MTNIQSAMGEYPVKSGLIGFAQFLELTGSHASLVGELIELGWLDPLRTGGDSLLFAQVDIYRVRKLVRLQRDLEIDPGAASIIVDLISRVEYLENKVRELSRLK